MYPQNDCLESDWKLFRKRVPVWQENYMAKLVEEYREILDSEKSPSEKFGALEGRIREDRKCPDVVIDMRRSTELPLKPGKGRSGNPGKSESAFSFPGAAVPHISTQTGERRQRQSRSKSAGRSY